jgi:hypothetical protein
MIWRYLSYWLAMGAAGIALNIIFALFGIGELHRVLKTASVKVTGGSELTRLSIIVSAIVGVVIGAAFSMSLGPLTLVRAFLGLRKPKEGS